MTVISLLEFSIRPDRLADADPIVTAVLDQTRSRPGNEGVEVLRDVDDPTRIVAVERWASLADDDAYRAWRATPEGASGLGEILAGAPRLTRWNQTAL